MSRDSQPRLADGRLHQMLAEAPDGAVGIAHDGRIVFWNHEAERILEYAPEEAIGRLCCDVFLGCDALGNRICHRGCPEMLVTMGEAIRTVDMLARTRAGRPVWLNVSILVLPENAEGAALTVHLFRDVTASKELLARVKEHLTPLAGSAQDAAGVLTPRELELLGLITLGLETEEAAERLQVTPALARSELQSIFTKLGVHSRVDAVAYAHTHHLL